MTFLDILPVVVGFVVGITLGSVLLNVSVYFKAKAENVKAQTEQIKAQTERMKTDIPKAW